MGWGAPPDLLGWVVVVVVAVAVAVVFFLFCFAVARQRRTPLHRMQGL